MVKPAAVKRLLTMLRKRLEDEEEVEVVAFDEFTPFDGGTAWWVELNNHSADNGERVYTFRLLL